MLKTLFSLTSQRSFNIRTMVKTRQSARASSTLEIHTVVETTISAQSSEPPKKRAKVRDASPSSSSKADEPPTEKVEKTKTKRKPRGQKAEVDKSQFLPRVDSLWKVGAHVSAAGGVENAVENAASIGANAFALFLKSQRKWESPPLKDECIIEFKKRMKEYGYGNRMVLPHGSYLINLGNPDADKREKSYVCFLDDLKRCEALDLDLYNFHPGSTVGETTVETSLGMIADCINRAHKETNSVTVVLENMAGAGNIIGSDFAHLAGIIKLVDDKSRVGVCLDTCHAFAAGYDIRTKEGWNSTLIKFDKQVGLKYLCGMHLNDSKTKYNSKKDRHQNIGLGHLGLLSFQHILQDPRTQNIPLILETPSFEQGKEVWGTEIAVLQRVSAGVAGRPDGPVDSGTAASIDLDALVEELRKSALKGVENDKKGAKSMTTESTGKAKAGKAKTAVKGSKRKRKNSEDEKEGDDEEPSEE